MRSSQFKASKNNGMVSEGMILGAKDENGFSLIRPEKPKKEGTIIK